MKQNRKPNVVFILTDEWRAQATGYAGDPNLNTPHLDALAAESTNVTLAVSGYPVCCPYRASLMTGQYALKHGLVVNNMELDPNYRSIAREFGAGGYDTAYIGKWHIYGSPEGRCERRKAHVPRSHQLGFDLWKGFECNHNYWDAPYFENDDPTPRTWEGYEPFAQTRDALDYLKSRQGQDNPFLLMLSWGPPHFPLHTAPENYRERFENRSIELRGNVPDAHKDRAELELQGYYAHIEALDDALKDLLEGIDAVDRENTIVVFTSDHGDMAYSQGLPHKLYPFEESIRVPFLIRWPDGMKGGREVDLPLDAPDLMPTLLSMCGLPIPSTVQGRDHAPEIRGEREVEHDANALLQVPISTTWMKKLGLSPYRGLRTRRHTYVVDEKGAGWLFDNESDPFQMVNLWDDEGSQGLKQELSEALQRRLEGIEDAFEDGETLIERYGVGHYREVLQELDEPWEYPWSKSS